MTMSATLQQMPSLLYESWRALMPRIPSEPASLTAPIIDCEPPPVGLAACPPPTSAALHRRSARRRRPVRGLPRDPLPPTAVVAFTDAALRRILEVVDRRRPIAQLRPLVAPALIEMVTALTRMPQNATAALGRVRVRMVDDRTGELFA